MSPSRAAVIGLGGVVVGLVGFITVTVAATNRHPGGDPNGTVLRTMRGIERAVPRDATHISRHEYPTQWVQGCSEVPNAHAGWNKETVYVAFSDEDSAAYVDQQISSALARSGWSLSPMRITKGQGTVPHWLRTVRQGQAINAFAYAVPKGASAWSLTASWQPQPVGQGCP
jgi:hypothetical protein